MSNIIVPLSEKIKDFKLIGEIDNGNSPRSLQKVISVIIQFLDLKMRNDKVNKKKFLEIYSDKTKPFLTEYSFSKVLQEESFYLHP